MPSNDYDDDGQFVFFGPARGSNGVLLIFIGIVLLVFLVVYQKNGASNGIDANSKAPLPRMAILVHTFDGYRRYWPGWIRFYQKYAAETVSHLESVKCYFATEDLAPSIPHDVHITHLRTGRGEWGYRLMRALEQIPEDYVLYMQEDMWFTSTLDRAYLKSAMRRAQDVSALKLQTNCHHNIQSADINRPDWYIVSHQPSIWKKSFLQSTLAATLTPFQHETRTNQMLHENPALTQACKCNLDFPHTPPFPYEDVSRVGKLRDVGADMLNAEGMIFDISKDEVLTRLAH